MNPATPPSTSPSGPSPGRIRVLEVIGNAIVGGMESCVERLIERLPRDRFAVTALCPYESLYTERLRALDIEVLIAPMPDDPPWASIQMTASLVAARGIELLHAHLPNAHLLAGVAARLANKPVMTTIHGRQLTTLDLELHRAVNSHLSVVCRQSYFHALGLGVNAAQLSCDTNGVDTERFQPRPGSTDAGLRALLGLADDTPLVGFIGRFSPEKGPETFVRAALLLRLRCPQAHCVMVGEGPLEGLVMHMADELGLAEHVHLVGVRHDMPAVYNELDVVVSSSHSEAMPLALMEAMASGLPVVATRVGGVPDMVEHGQTGWLVGPGDFQDIAGRCAGLLFDDAARVRLGQRARRRAVAHFNLDDSVDGVARLLTRLARPQRSGSHESPMPRRVAAVGNGGSGAVVSAVGIAANGSTANGLVAKGSAVNGSTANGSAANGSAANGSSAELPAADAPRRAAASAASRNGARPAI